MFGRRERRHEVTTASPVESSKSPWRDGLGVFGIRSVQIIAIVVLATGVIFGLNAVSLVVIPILIALILASAFEPVTGWLRRRGVPDVLATIGVLLTVVVVLGLLGWLITNAVRAQWDDLKNQAIEGYNQVVEWLKGFDLPFLDTDGAGLIDEASMEEFSTWAQDFVTSSQFGSGALSGLGLVANFATGFVLMIVVLFFFLKDGPKLWAFMLRPFQGVWYARAQRAGNATVTTFGSYVRGTATVALVDAVGIYIGLKILQVPLAEPLAVLVFILAFIPIVGATLAGVLAALVALVANGFVNALLVTGVVVLVNQLEGNLLQPVLMGRALKLHPLVVLLALTIGTILGGIVGAVLAVPLTAVAWAIVQVWDGTNTPARWARAKHADAG